MCIRRNNPAFIRSLQLLMILVALIGNHPPFPLIVWYEDGNLFQARQPV